MYKAINQWSFPAGMKVREMMDMAKKNGYEGFEPALSLTGELSMESGDAEFTAIKEYAADIGIKITSLAAGLTWDYSPTASDPAVRATAAKQLRRQMECAKLLGTDAILHVPGTVGAGFWGSDDQVEYDVCWARAQENLGVQKDYAKELGVIICVENVWNNFLMSPFEMARFIDEVNSDYVKAYLDVGNVLKFGMPQTWARILGERVYRVHVKDFKRAVGNLDGFVDLLNGDLDFDTVLGALRSIGYNGPLTAEMNSGYSYYPADVIYRTARALELVLGER